ncbi:MAG: N-acetyltransferase [Methylococcaceae bacterium]|nr:N-acetyltransferase [Methylococcaceae bacterium]
MTCRVVEQLAAVDAAEWNRCVGDDVPYLRHEFLRGLEDHGCLGDTVGWLPRHLLMEQGGELKAAVPLYLKFNSFGEFVFDQAWAHAYQQAGLEYYPKLVAAAPFTPATGPRLLLAPGGDPVALADSCIGAVIELAQELRLSSCHWLFPSDAALLQSPRLLLRKGYQFHWRNQGWRDFEDYLAAFCSRRRKQLRKERRTVAESDVVCRRVMGTEATEADWRFVFRCYRDTFLRHGNYPALTLGFFRHLGRTMGESVMLVVAERRREPVAAAFFLVGSKTLYGRYWGALEDIPGLHFETCYYQGLDFCLERGLEKFEPGAQGEHKISRGFLPSVTWSAHWIADARFRPLIAAFLAREKQGVSAYMEQLMSHSPFRAG